MGSDARPGTAAGRARGATRADGGDGRRARVAQASAAGLVLVVGLAAAMGCGEPAPPPDLAALYGVAPVPPQGVELETRFSRVRIRDEGTIRTLYFVAEDGEEIVESRMDLERPEVLVVPYTRTLFASYLFVPEPQRVLVVGYGAGSMVRFLEHHDPEVVVEAIDIDPEIVAIAEEYFGMRPQANVRVADGYEVLRTAEVQWDVVFLDAFLGPSEETDSTGVPLRLKEIPFYEAVKAHLADGGVVCFNINSHARIDEDVAGIRRAFGPIARFRSRWANEIVVASKAGALPAREVLERRAAAADARLQPTGWSFEELLSELRYANGGE